MPDANLHADLMAAYNNPVGESYFDLTEVTEDFERLLAVEVSPIRPSKRGRELEGIFRKLRRAMARLGMVKASFDATAARYHEDRANGARPLFKPFDPASVPASPMVPIGLVQPIAVEGNGDVLVQAAPPGGALHGH